ncbi:MAG: hypothetical protein FJ207_05665 [Gemmatimonadetes bacterium]|nr:hypothetical protein [Gemmatimonadota bacterium]
MPRRVVILFLALVAASSAAEVSGQATGGPPRTPPAHWGPISINIEEVPDPHPVHWLPTIRGVGDELVLGDASRQVALYPITDSPHASTLLMAYLPRERLLVEADAFSPGSAVAPYAANLLENIRRRNLRVDRIVPIHGTVVPFSELTRTVAALATN